MGIFQRIFTNCMHRYNQHKKSQPINVFLKIWKLHEHFLNQISMKKIINSIISQTLMSLTIDFNMCMPRHDVFEHLFAVSTCIIFLIPMIIITVLYIMICIQLRRSKVVKRATISGSSVRLKVSWSRVYFIRRNQVIYCHPLTWTLPKSVSNVGVMFISL